MAHHRRRSSEEAHSPLDPEQVREELRARFRSLPGREREVMREIQNAVRQHVPPGVSLVDELAADRRGET